MYGGGEVFFSGHPIEFCRFRLWYVIEEQQPGHLSFSGFFPCTRIPYSWCSSRARRSCSPHRLFLFPFQHPFSNSLIDRRWYNIARLLISQHVVNCHLSITSSTLKSRRHSNQSIVVSVNYLQRTHQEVYNTILLSLSGPTGCCIQGFRSKFSISLSWHTTQLGFAVASHSIFGPWATLKREMRIQVVVFQRRLFRIMAMS